MVQENSTHQLLSDDMMKKTPTRDRVGESLTSRQPDSHGFRLTAGLNGSMVQTAAKNVTARWTDAQEINKQIESLSESVTEFYCMYRLVWSLLVRGVGENCYELVGWVDLMWSVCARFDA